MVEPDNTVDLFVIGGGVNGTGIARDAAGRGLSVMLAEKGDLASATSSGSTKLFHGGLRYLEYFKFRLVREGLTEREVLLRAMPHISWPMRFVLPLHPEMRFEGDTPTSRLLTWVMPWMRGKRPAWLIRLGLFLYDHMGGREILPGTRALDLGHDPAGAALKPEMQRAYEYSDCWVDDARLVVLNARDAATRGATVLVQTEVTFAKRVGDLWQITLRDGAGVRKVKARALVNAGGPWVSRIVDEVIQTDSRENVTLVRGSHIILPRLFDHDRAYFLQGSDGRIIFAIPYEDDFTLIGTTDETHDTPNTPPVCTDEERDYLIAFAAQYFDVSIRTEDIAWTYSGVRPLYDDGASSATAATRDYVLTLDQTGAPLLNVFGGKITTYRRLAEAALAKLALFFPEAKGNWTAAVPLPGGDFAVSEKPALTARLMQNYPFLSEYWAARLMRTYGTDARLLLGDAKASSDLGQDFGATLSEAELRWMKTQEFATCGEDALWRRTKLGLRLDAQQRAAVENWFSEQN
ncbi:homodimeric glycerol 3-phosphate dehydrogenase (quinone) [Shimia gijangensis]|uniref:Glycerol-3-phosphate dehydrogenase n=1 Tax=Shimia gijangensis TaxID=1470563 RepID=A0A1M6ITB1_9RHOB|nr:glycerol-3-phosphate dehydrogenase [Shimia gijangensis]SHJ37710.1 homodimeric glycerol 3-phosphate dehydrogenase (quinone) [Shimia gijangensis]